MFIGLIVNVLMSLITAMMNKTDKERPEFKEMEDPEAEAGKPIPVVFGTVWILQPNLINGGSKEKLEKEVPAGSSKGKGAGGGE